MFGLPKLAIEASLTASVEINKTTLAHIGAAEDRLRQSVHIVWVDGLTLGVDKVSDLTLFVSLRLTTFSSRTTFSSGFQNLKKTLKI